MNQLLEMATHGCLFLVLLAAIYFWGRGIQNSCISDLIAGPVILAAICLGLLFVIKSSAVFSLVGGLIIVFGIATLILSAMTRPAGKIKKRNVRVIGIGMIILGFCLSLIL